MKIQVSSGKFSGKISRRKSIYILYLYTLSIQSKNSLFDIINFALLHVAQQAAQFSSK